LLLDLAEFLRRRELLTDGGGRSLSEGLLGRNDFVSLGLQDVRSHAHGLVVKLLLLSSDSWAACTEEYFQTYDRGKPRRPTHLQRLYLQWSSDLDWPGLLKACRHHPTLWPEIETALSRLEEPSQDKAMLTLALRCFTTPDAWREAFEEDDADRSSLLRLLPLLPVDRAQSRLLWLADTATKHPTEVAWGIELIRACHLDFLEARALRTLEFNRAALERMGLSCLGQERFDAVFVSAFRSFVLHRETVAQLFAAIGTEDPLRRAVFGPRPGVLWLEAQKAEMLRFTELPSR